MFVLCLPLTRAKNAFFKVSSSEQKANHAIRGCLVSENLDVFTRFDVKQPSQLLISHKTHQTPIHFL